VGKQLISNQFDASQPLHNEPCQAPFFVLSSLFILWPFAGEVNTFCRDYTFDTDDAFRSTAALRRTSLPASAERFIELNDTQQLIQPDLGQRQLRLKQIAVGV
jgi:hypothetical protein